MKDKLRFYPGFVGLHTRQQAEGAMENGTLVEKRFSDPDDTHQDGAQGTILGSLACGDGTFLYFVAWNDNPKVAVMNVSLQIGPI